MEIKVIEGEVHFKKKRLVLFKGEIKKGTYVILPIGGMDVRDGLLIPIVEDYDSL